jgi:predicted ATPase
LLKRVDVSNFKSIERSVVEFGRRNIIVGPNATGKSNLLDVLKFTRDAAQVGLDEAVSMRHGIDSIRRWSKTRPYIISIKLEFVDLLQNEKGFFKFSLASKGGEFTVTEEEGVWLGVDPLEPSERDVPFRARYKRDASGKIELEAKSNIYSTLPAPRLSQSELLITQFNPNISSPYSLLFRGLYAAVIDYGAYSIYPNVIRDPQPVSTNTSLQDDGKNLASVIRKLRSTSTRSKRESLTNALAQVLPSLSEIKIQNTAGFYLPTFKVDGFDGKNPHYLNMSQVSDGTLRMLGMLSAFYQQNPPERVALEEPEQMIHPGLLPVLFEAAEDYLEGNQSRQLFLTTHSPTLLDMFDVEDIIVAHWENDISSFSPISERQRDIVRQRLFTAGELMVVEGLIL